MLAGVIATPFSGFITFFEILILKKILSRGFFNVFVESRVVEFKNEKQVNVKFDKKLQKVFFQNRNGFLTFFLCESQENYLP